MPTGQEGLRRWQRKRTSGGSEAEKGGREGEERARAGTSSTTRQPLPPHSSPFHTGPPPLGPYQQPSDPSRDSIFPPPLFGLGQHTVYRSRDEIPPHVLRTTMIHPSHPHHRQSYHSTYINSSYQPRSHLPPMTSPPASSAHLHPPSRASQNQTARADVPRLNPVEDGLQPHSTLPRTSSSRRMEERGGFGGWSAGPNEEMAGAPRAPSRLSPTHGAAPAGHTAASSSQIGTVDTSNWYEKTREMLNAGSGTCKSFNIQSEARH